MKVLVTGASGQLGSDVVLELESRGMEIIAPSHEEFDITNQGLVLQMFEYTEIDAVVHCAAYTAVDLAQEEHIKCHNLNASATRSLAKQCGRLEIPMVYISTDYVFGGAGEEPYEVNDKKSPLNEYGLSKLAGEEAMKAFCNKHFIIRVSWLFGKNGKNFPKTILRLAETRDEISVVADQIGSPTYTKDLAKLIADMLKTKNYGIYHATNEGFVSFFDYAKEIVRQSGKNLIINPTTTDKYKSAARRPLNSRLSKQSLVEAGFELLPPWEDALSRFLKELKI
ncbi:MAG: dTDP-4-dehydrorhamnose reductase [Ruminococcaceae bacterium]|nr:dTDP-4-dehydrorhamnose reductase [Oscillospiraceae bacterium]